MRTYTIHQLNITDEIFTAVNTLGHEGAIAKFPIWGFKMDMFLVDENFPYLTSEQIGFYHPVCTILADDLEGVFDTGNIGPEENIMRLTPRMHSVSVGDIVVNNETGEASMVASMGFIKINFK
tara:strand:- start:22 stop:390 length:369 start_codon:yes stop_codon:yes gene_type:complete